MGIKNSTQIHNKIIKKLLHGSITKFFNLIITGRVINRLSKDIYEIDYSIPDDINNL